MIITLFVLYMSCVNSIKSKTLRGNNLLAEQSWAQYQQVTNNLIASQFGCEITSSSID